MQCNSLWCFSIVFLEGGVVVFFHNIFGRGAILVGFNVSNRCAFTCIQYGFQLVALVI